MEGTSRGFSYFAQKGCKDSSFLLCHQEASLLLSFLSLLMTLVGVRNGTCSVQEIQGETCQKTGEKITKGQTKKKLKALQVNKLSDKSLFPLSQHKTFRQTKPWLEGDGKRETPPPPTNILLVTLTSRVWCYVCSTLGVLVGKVKEGDVTPCG